MPLINVVLLDNIFRDCLFREGEATDGMVEVDGIVSRFGFHPDRLAQHRDEIEKMLSYLPDPFQEKIGGGWSFLNACNDRNDEQWTGLHIVMEQLVVLGVAIDKVAYLMPREMWDVFPGGMPYFVVKA